MTDAPRLIEGYLPIEAMSKEAAREKSVRKGHVAARFFEILAMAVQSAVKEPLHNSPVLYGTF